MSRLLALIGIAALATAAAAQTNATFVITSSNFIHPGTPATTIEVWAAWDDPQGTYLFGGADYDLIAGDGVFFNPINILNGPSSSVGAVAGNSIVGAINGQLHIPPLGMFGATDNPILLATYEWTTSDFTQRVVNLATENTSNFVVAERRTGLTTRIFPSGFSPGYGQIHTIPSPSAMAVFAWAGVIALRRKRA
jgi:hypothetical protein